MSTETNLIGRVLRRQHERAARIATLAEQYSSSADEERADLERAASEDLTALLPVLSELLQAFSILGGEGIAEHFTCSEADTLASLMVVAGHTRDAEHFIASHSYSDEDGDAHDFSTTDAGGFVTRPRYAEAAARAAEYVQREIIG